MFTAFSRVVKSGFQTFYRNGWLSAATVGIMTMTLFVFSSLLLFTFLTKQIVGIVQDKIDISLYFNTSVDESEILKARDILRQLPEVASVNYISSDEALAQFNARHQNNTVILQALQELGSNPLEASLQVKAKDSSQYAAIASFVDQAPFKSEIEKVNFSENQTVIDRLNRLTDGVKRTGILLSVILAGMACLISFNTIRMAIYSLREEIGIMKLVGASNWFAKGPFVVAGILIGIIASVLTLAILWPVVSIVSPKVAAFVPGTDLYGYFQGNLLNIFLLQTAAGVFLGIASSLIATNKYLRV